MFQDLCNIEFKKGVYFNTITKQGLVSETMLDGEAKVKVKHMTFVLQNEAHAMYQMAKWKHGSGNGERYLIEALPLLNAAFEANPSDADVRCFYADCLRRSISYVPYNEVNDLSSPLEIVLDIC
jgi:hypothetical protein